MYKITKEDSGDIDKIFVEINNLIKKFEEDSNKEELKNLIDIISCIRKEIKYMVEGGEANRNQLKKHIKNTEKILSIIDTQKFKGENGFYDDMKETQKIIQKRIDVLSEIEMEPQSEEIKECSKLLERILHIQRSQVNNGTFLSRFFNWLGEKLRITEPSKKEDARKSNPIDQNRPLKSASSQNLRSRFKARMSRFKSSIIKKNQTKNREYRQSNCIEA